MNHRPHFLRGLLFVLLPLLILLTAVVLWAFHVESIESTQPVPLPSLKTVHPDATVPDASAEDVSNGTSATPISAFHSKTIDAHLARLEAERLAAEKAAAEKAEAERLAAEKAAADKAAAEKAEAERLAAEKAAAEKAAADAAAAAAAAKKKYEIVYHGMMDRVDGSLLAFIENKTDGTTFYYQKGEPFLFGTIQDIHSRSVTLQVGTVMHELTINEPTILEEP